MNYFEIEDMRFFTYLFRERFQHLFDKRIVLYGLNRKTYDIIFAFPEANIVGIMGKDCTEQYICGKKVYSLYNIGEAQADVLIVVRKEENFVDTALYVAEVAKKYNFSVYSVRGYSALEYVELLPHYSYMKALQNCIADELVDSIYAGIFSNIDAEGSKKAAQLVAGKLASLTKDKAGRVVLSNPKDYAYCCIGPIMASYIGYLMREIDSDCYDKILFAARDGFLLKELYENALGAKALPEKYVYFYTSRNACIGATTGTEEDFLYFENYSNIENIREITEYRYALADNSLSEFNPSVHYDVFQYYNDNKVAILNASSTLRKNYAKYLKRLGIASTDKLAFVDLVSMGTCPQFFCKMTENPIHGFFLGKYDNYMEPQNICRLPVSAMYERLNSEEKDSFSPYIFNHYWFLETVLSSPEPSLRHFDENGNPVFAKENRTKEQIDCMVEMQNGIRSFFDDLLKLCGEMPEISPVYGERLYRMSDSGFLTYDFPEMQEIVLFEDLGQKTIKISL